MKEKRSERAPGGPGLRASYTVEATLLMSILLPLLMSLLFAGFYLHDRERLRAAACESAALAACMVTDAARARKTETAADSLADGPAMWLRGRGAQTSVTETSASVVMRGSFPVPSAAGLFPGTGTRQCVVECERKILHPADLIRKVRGIKKAADTILGTGTSAE